MFKTTANIAAYNLSAGKNLPDWAPKTLRKKLSKEDHDIENRIELIQDFEMPVLSSSIKMTEDQQYVYAAGIYKPRIRCFDLNNLSMKFERCLDADTVCFEYLTPDGSKLVILRDDRYLEVHTKGGKYYMFRIPSFGRSLAFNANMCDLYACGSSSQVWRFNFQQGRYLNSLQTNGTSINTCKVNPVHQLFVCGTEEGHVEAWDPRCRERVGTLDIAFAVAEQIFDTEGLPGVTSIAFRDGLTMGVGTSTGQVLIYDIRANKPSVIKDHKSDSPIKSIAFHLGTDYVLSMDKFTLKLWEQGTGKHVSHIQEPGCEFNDLCLVPDSGMMFVANNTSRILTYFLPSLGLAPKWCSFLDCLTEELEQSNQTSFFPDCKFITKKELSELALTCLIGTKFLRAYMHGYFIHSGLYHNARIAADPFSYQDHIKRKVKAKIDEERDHRVKLKKLPKVNQAYADARMNDTLLKDKRFAALFEKPEFEIDQKSQDFKNKVKVSSTFRMLGQILQEKAHQTSLALGVDEQENRKSDSEDEFSSDDERKLLQELRNVDENTNLLQEVKTSVKSKPKKALKPQKLSAKSAPKFYQLKEGEEFVGLGKTSRPKPSRETLGERLAKEERNSKKIPVKRKRTD